MNALNIIRQPVITEKASLLQEQKVYAFWVNPKATKIGVKAALKQIYGADIAKVRMVRVSPKFRAVRKGILNKRKETLKAYVTLAKGAKLDLNKFEKTEKTTEVKIKATEKKPASQKTAAKSKKD